MNTSKTRALTAIDEIESLIDGFGRLGELLRRRITSVISN